MGAGAGTPGGRWLPDLRAGTSAPSSPGAGKAAQVLRGVPAEEPGRVIVAVPEAGQCLLKLDDVRASVALMQVAVRSQRCRAAAATGRPSSSASTWPGRTRPPRLARIFVTVILGNGADARTMVVRPGRIRPGSMIGSRSTRSCATPVITEVAGAAVRAASWLGDSINLAAARPAADIAITPTATPARKKRLVLNGSSLDPAPGPPCTADPPSSVAHATTAQVTGGGPSELVNLSRWNRGRTHRPGECWPVRRMGGLREVARRGSWRVARFVGADGNPLRRGIDRMERAVWILLVDRVPGRRADAGADGRAGRAVDQQRPGQA